MTDRLQHPVTDADAMLADPTGPLALNLPDGAIVDHVIIIAQWRLPSEDGRARLTFNHDADLPPWTMQGMIGYVQDLTVTESVCDVIDRDDDDD